MEIKSANDNECIKNLNAFKQGNDIIIKWDWPELNTNIDYVYIFEIEDETEILESLIKRNAKYFSFSRRNYIENDCCKRTISNDIVRYRVFPIKAFNNTTYILNQKSNLTNAIYKSIFIEYSIESKQFKTKKILKLVFPKKDTLSNIPDNSIVYNKYDSNNNYICTYPLDIDLILKEEYNILVNKGEQIRLALKNKDKDIIKFHLK